MSKIAVSGGASGGGGVPDLSAVHMKMEPVDIIKADGSWVWFCSNASRLFTKQQDEMRSASFLFLTFMEYDGNFYFERRVDQITVFHNRFGSSSDGAYTISDHTVNPRTIYNGVTGGNASSCAQSLILYDSGMDCLRIGSNRQCAIFLITEVY